MKYFLFHAVVLMLFIAVAQSAGLIGSLFTFSSIDLWYQFLTKPPLTPPEWIFGPVWTLLYALMGIATYLVWRTDKPEKWKAISLFLIHLVVNAAWSIIFFGAQNITLALVVICILLAYIAWLMRIFSRFSKLAALLLLPYLLWVLFATYLNLAFLILN